MTGTGLARGDPVLDVAYKWQVLSLEVGKRIFFRTENQVTFYMMACVIKEVPMNVRGTGAYNSAHFQDEFIQALKAWTANDHAVLLHNRPANMKVKPTAKSAMKVKPAAKSAMKAKPAMKVPAAMNAMN
ncbi:unnamed protein product [Effrenium voratum]|uniref:Uncharacterized protein n=1 Tax=Effrenium voratum TaxID=2562239 RepID=A0AA36HLT8_9DINO|nr:unnamed protein product [Effrenium voratum]